MSQIATIAFDAIPAASSEAIALQGKPARTPMLAGAICGSVMGAAWIIGFSIYFYKRYRRRKRRLAGEEPVQEKEMLKEPLVIPQDPAVTSGLYKPGQTAHIPKHTRSTSHVSKKSLSKDKESDQAGILNVEANGSTPPV
ncbi:hypothetical protein DL96DRAFT_1709550 [Flagelloscypha sp. PMI_526]|nr:hypothetical protein DL96DRAFT_1709550 [Flagelloscypha sp. PMI_526]